MSRKRKELKSCSILFVAGALVGLCAISFLGVQFVSNLPEQVSTIYGPPADSIPPRQRFTLALKLWWAQPDLSSPLNSDGETQRFEILDGDSADAVLQRLSQQGLISNVDALRNYLIFTGRERNLQAGTYELSSAMSPIEVAEIILDATPRFVTFAILAGWRLEEIMEALPTSGLNISPEEFLVAATLIPSGYSFSSQLLDAQSVEGFLLPGVYELSRNMTSAELIRVFLNNFETSLTEEIRNGILKQGLSIREAVIIASIVEREAVISDEQPIIASVFINRLKIGMALEADPTVQYAIGYNTSQSTWWTNPLTLADLNVDSLYNTYIYAGMPPGPISNPSLSAIMAIAFPAETTFYYFRATCDDSGYHNFSETYEQLVSYAC